MGPRTGLRAVLLGTFLIEVQNLQATAILSWANQCPFWGSVA